MARIKVRKGMLSVQLIKNEFAKRKRERFYDPDFDKLTPAIDKIIATAWRTYDEYHKSPRARRAGGGFADPDFKLPIEWLETRADPGRGAPAKGCKITVAHPHRQRFITQRPHLSR
jgi:hypothetical protein